MKLFNRLKAFYNATTTSIAFYPILFAVGAIILALITNWMESAGISAYLDNHAPVFAVSDLDTARNLTTTLVAGGISMLVFSFSMVMLLLSQAASNYSPRVLPSLISEKRHQIVLGTFLAFILYNIFVLISIDPDGGDYQLPGFSVLLGVSLSIAALGMFVYFIHSISTSIQINHIMKDIFTLSRKRIKELIDNQKKIDGLPDTSDWHAYSARESGTVQNISFSGLKEEAIMFETKLKIEALKGFYITRGQTLFLSEKKLEEDDLGNFHQYFNYIEAELVSDNYILGFKQLAEIGVKAMSPGVNDPGTAMDSINHLTELFSLRMQKLDYDVTLDEDDQPVVHSATVSFKNLIYGILAPYRNYSKHDFTVVYRLLYMLKVLKGKEAVNEEYYDYLKEQGQLLIDDASGAMDNENDLEILRELHES